jgi:RNA polymerase sigma-70 factor (ECF subfamily)
VNTDVFLARIVAGDATAFAEWLARAETPVRLSLSSFARSVDVEAVLQESLLRVWQVAPRFVSDGAPNGLLRLAVRIARNLAISEVRRTRATPVEAVEVAVAPVEPDPLLRRAIIDCRDKLPAKPRQVLDARLAGGDDEDLATKLAMKLNTFLQNFTRARQLLADCLGKKGISV